MNNREIEERLEAYREMLRSGQIDETTFNNMVKRNLGYDIDVNKAKRPRKRLAPLIVVVFLCFLVLGIYRFINKDRIELTEKNYEIVDNLQRIDPPIQNAYTGNTYISVNNILISMEYVATYEVSGRVVSFANYVNNSVMNALAEKDITLTWGKLATDEYEKYFTWRSPGNRFVYWKTNNITWYRQHTDDAEVTSMYANNHLVTTDFNLKRQIAAIKKGDFVRIKGYLVNLDWQEDGYNRYWNSSTIRTDDGDGACEVIYVTEVKWLKEA